MASVATARCGVDALTTQAIVQRDSVAKNYVPIIHPVMNLPMQELRSEGDCEITDPRACLNHYNSAADLACVLYCYISHFYFKAMIKAGYITQGLRVVRYCMEKDRYEECVVVNQSDGAGDRDESVEEMLLKYKNKEGSCRSGVELINLETGYQFRPITVRKRTRGPNGVAVGSVSQTYTGAQWARKLAEDKKLQDCKRKMVNDEMARTLSGATCRKEGQGSPEGSVVIPTLIIMGVWDFSGVDNQRKPPVYASQRV